MTGILVGFCLFFCCDKELDTCNLKRENSSWLQFRIYSPQRQEAMGAGNRGSWSYTLAVKNQHVMSAGFLLDFSFLCSIGPQATEEGFPHAGWASYPHRHTQRFICQVDSIKVSINTSHHSK